MNIWKKLLLINSILWILAATYCVYAVMYGILSLDWKHLMYGILALGVFSISQVVVAIIGD
jgi:hypothetical protein